MTPDDFDRLVAKAIIGDATDQQPPPLVPMEELIEQVNAECRRREATERLVERQQALLRNWKRAEAEGDAEGMALCREAAKELVAEHARAQGQAAFKYGNAVFYVDETKLSDSLEHWSWT